MGRIREDLIGVVHAGEYVLKAGETVPAGVVVGDDLLEADVEEVKPEPKRRVRPSKSEE